MLEFTPADKRVSSLHLQVAERVLAVFVPMRQTADQSTHCWVLEGAPTGDSIVQNKDSCLHAHLHDTIHGHLGIGQDESSWHWRVSF